MNLTPLGETELYKVGVWLHVTFDPVGVSKLAGVAQHQGELYKMVM